MPGLLRCHTFLPVLVQISLVREALRAVLTVKALDPVVRVEMTQKVIAEREAMAAHRAAIACITTLTSRLLVKVWGDMMMSSCVRQSLMTCPHRSTPNGLWLTVGGGHRIKLNHASRCKLVCQVHVWKGHRFHCYNIVSVSTRVAFTQLNA
jgi:hypothetical protein